MAESGELYECECECVKVILSIVVIYDHNISNVKVISVSFYLLLRVFKVLLFAGHMLDSMVPIGVVFNDQAESKTLILEASEVLNCVVWLVRCLIFDFLNRHYSLLMHSFS